MNHHDAGSAELDPQALPSEVPPGSAVRGGPEWRQLSFRASGLTIELEITGSGGYRRLIGQLIPRQSAVVDVRHGHGVITVEADSLGRFSAEEVPFGQVSLRCRLGSDQAPIVTGWISLLTAGAVGRAAAGPARQPGSVPVHPYTGWAARLFAGRPTRKPTTTELHDHCIGVHVRGVSDAHGPEQETPGVSGGAGGRRR